MILWCTRLTQVLTQKDPMIPSVSPNSYRPTSVPQVTCSSVRTFMKYGMAARSEVLLAQVTHWCPGPHGAARIFPKDELVQLCGPFKNFDSCFFFSSPLFKSWGETPLRFPKFVLDSEGWWEKGALSSDPDLAPDGPSLCLIFKPGIITPHRIFVRLKKTLCDVLTRYGAHGRHLINV